MIVLLPLLGFWVYQTMIPHSFDSSFYQEQLEEKKIASSHSTDPTHQHRTGVQKEIWFTQDDSTRLHYKILSEKSVLTLLPVKNKINVVEKLQGIKCFMQDKLYYSGNSPMQQTRYFEAAEGVYKYSTLEFIASQVNLSLFELPSHILPEKPLEKTKAMIHGIAKNISFHFAGKTPQFHADHFQATVVKHDLR